MTIRIKQKRCTPLGEAGMFPRSSPSFGYPQILFGLVIVERHVRFPQKPEPFRPQFPELPNHSPSIPSADVRSPQKTKDFPYSRFPEDLVNPPARTLALLNHRELCPPFPRRFSSRAEDRAGIRRLPAPC